MTIQELYDYAKERNALDYQLSGTSISCGIDFDKLKVIKEWKSILICSGTPTCQNKEGFDFIPHRDKKSIYEKYGIK